LGAFSVLPLALFLRSNRALRWTVPFLPVTDRWPLLHLGTLARILLILPPPPPGPI
jgi:hypothetical protein